MSMKFTTNSRLQWGMLLAFGSFLAAITTLSSVLFGIAGGVAIGVINMASIFVFNVTSNDPLFVWGD